MSRVRPFLSILECSVEDEVFTIVVVDVAHLRVLGNHMSNKAVRNKHLNFVAAISTPQL